MSATVANLNVKVGGDTSEAKTKLNELSGHVNTVGEHFKSALGNILGFATGAVAIGAVTVAAGFLVGQMKDVITAGMDQQKVMTETDTVLKSMGGSSGQTAKSVGEYADSMARATGISDDLIQHTENVLLTFGNIGGKVFPEATTAALNMSTMLGQDLQSSIIQVGKALNDPVKGMTALSRVGVSFSEVEKQTIKTMMAHNDVAGAQGVIMYELNKQFGGAAVAAGTTFGGQMARLNVVMDQAKEKIGLALLPILSKIVSLIMSEVAPALARLSDNVQAVLVPALSRAAVFVQANLLPAFMKMAAFVQSDVLPGLLKLGSFIASNVIPVLAQLEGWLITKVVPILQTLWSVIQTAILPVVEQLWKNIAGNLIPALQHLWDKIGPLLIPVIQLIGWQIEHFSGPVLGFLINVIAKLIEGLAWLIGKIVDGMTPAFQSAAHVMSTEVGPALSGVSKFIGDLIGHLGDAIGKIGDFLGMLGRLKDMAGATLGAIGSDLHNAHIPGFATGGVVPYTGVFRVGELGPETVVLPGGSRVIPNNQSQPNSGGGGNGSTYNITMNGTNMGIQDLERELWRQAVLHG